MTAESSRWAMPELPKIADETTLEAWLNTRPLNDSVIIAYRAAMRVLPIWSAAIGENLVREHDFIIPLVLRCALISGVAHNYPTLEITRATSASKKLMTNETVRLELSPAGEYSAVDHAIRAVKMSSDSAIAIAGMRGTAAASRASGSATSAVISAASALNDVTRSTSGLADAKDFECLWPEIDADYHRLLEGADPHGDPLWPKRDNPLANMWASFRLILSDTPGGEFWIDWYQRALDGRPQNWPMLRDIALIDDKIWQQGGEALEQAIYSLIAEQGLRYTTYGEDIIVDPDTLELRAVPHNDLPPDYLQDIRDKIGDCGRILPENSGTNAYTGLPDDVEMLQDAGERYADRPRMLYSAVSRAQRRIEGRIESGDCVDDVVTADLRATVAEIRTDLLAYSPEVRESVKLHSELSPKKEPPRNAEQIVAVVDAVAANFENYPHDEMPEDIRVVNDPDALIEDRKEAAIRTTWRLLRVRLLLLRDKTLKVGRDVTEALKEIGAVAAGVTATTAILYAAIRLLFYLT